MKWRLLCVGSLKSTPLQALWDKYTKRLTFKGHVVEVSARGDDKEAESRALLDKISSQDTVYLLDEGGQNLTSQEFSQLIHRAQVEGIKSLTFVIGGASGFSEIIRKAGFKSLAFGAQTWPHELVRVLLIEQLYRAQQILSNHPYHKE